MISAYLHFFITLLLIDLLNLPCYLSMQYFSVENSSFNALMHFINHKWLIQIDWDEWFDCSIFLLHRFPFSGESIPFAVVMRSSITIQSSANRMKWSDCKYKLEPFEESSRRRLEKQRPPSAGAARAASAALFTQPAATNRVRERHCTLSRCSVTLSPQVSLRQRVTAHKSGWTRRAGVCDTGLATSKG